MGSRATGLEVAAMSDVTAQCPHCAHPAFVFFKYGVQAVQDWGSDIFPKGVGFELCTGRLVSFIRYTIACSLRSHEVGSGVSWVIQPSDGTLQD